MRDRAKLATIAIAQPACKGCCSSPRSLLMIPRTRAKTDEAPNFYHTEILVTLEYVDWVDIDDTGQQVSSSFLS
jgi:hypothetical protein